MAKILRSTVLGACLALSLSHWSEASEPPPHVQAMHYAGVDWYAPTPPRAPRTMRVRYIDAPTLWYMGREVLGLARLKANGDCDVEIAAARPPREVQATYVHERMHCYGWRHAD